MRGPFVLRPCSKEAIPGLWWPCHDPGMARPMKTSLFTALIVLPGNALVFIPALIVWLTRETSFAAQIAGPSHVFFWVGVAAAA